MIDNEASVHSQANGLRSCGLKVHVFDSAYGYLTAYNQIGTLSCIVCELCLPGTGGIDLQLELQRRYAITPLVLMSGRADIATAVKAMQAGAIDFLEKPICLERLKEVIRNAVEDFEHSAAACPFVIQLSSW